MQSRTFCFIAVFVGSSVFAFLALATPVAVGKAPTDEEQKVLLDCRHSDYRTYIQCLKRHKRHHAQHDGDHMEIDGSCIETCLKKCSVPHDCDRQCSHCLRRTKHKHQIITEYETECVSGNCTNSGDKPPIVPAGATNITTKIDINNYIGNNSCCPTCRPPTPCQYPPYPPPYSPPYAPSLPQLTLVPQLTLGLGLGLGAGSYPSHWPIPASQPGPDCSMCVNPFLRYRCDVSCYVANDASMINYINRGNTNTEIPCKQPYCVGGSK